MHGFMNVRRSVDFDNVRGIKQRKLSNSEYFETLAL